MEWLTALQGKVVGLDTTPLIYLIEEHPVYLERVRSFFRSMDRAEFTVVTSNVTLLEVLVHPFRHQDVKLAEQYRSILLNARGVDHCVNVGRHRRGSCTGASRIQNPHTGCHPSCHCVARRSFVSADERRSVTPH
jgi:hypothetical protein